MDGDGYLDATDVTSALCSRNVNITPEQAQMFLEGRPHLSCGSCGRPDVLLALLLTLSSCSVVSDVDSDHKVGRHEFDDFIFHMAAADLAHGSQPQEVSLR